MLDVHPPEHTPHSWRDFFVHIATIVVGLLIAVGLEQAVERIHEHRQVSEARTMLHEELERNRNIGDANSAAVDAHLAELWKDLDVVARVRAHKSLPADQILFVRPSFVFQSAAWQTVHSSTVSEHMDPHVLADYGFIYDVQQAINGTSAALSAQLQDSLSPLVAGEDPRPETTRQIEDIESQVHSAADMAAARSALSHNNHPDRLSAAQLDTVERALYQGIFGDRRLQRSLASIHHDYEDFPER